MNQFIYRVYPNHVFAEYRHTASFSEAHDIEREIRAKDYDGEIVIDRADVTNYDFNKHAVVAALNGELPYIEWEQVHSVTNIK